MRAVSENVRERYGVHDVDAALFLDSFSASAGAKVLVVGAHDEATANMMADSGFRVWGVDLRGYDRSLPPCNYTFLRGDFCEPDFLNALVIPNAPFDAFVCLSSLEHFGMGSYREGQSHRYYDVVAMRKAWELLRVGARAYVTVPFGSHFIEVWPHWRIYDLDSAKNRLVQDFRLLSVESVSSGDMLIQDQKIGWGTKLTQEQVVVTASVSPAVSTLLVMDKVEVKRSPRGEVR